MADSTSNGNGIGFFSILTIVFIVLKLVGTIDWSWWWVLAPTWIPFAVVGAIFLLVMLVALIGQGSRRL
jgi:hypothetical protein